MAKTKQEDPEVKTLKNEEVEEESEKSPLPGFDMSNYVAKPIDSNIVIKRKITTILARKPNSQTYFQVHPTLEVLVDVLDWKDENTLYLVNQEKIND